METTAVVRQFEVHVVVKLCEGQSSDFAEVLTSIVHGKEWDHDVNSDKINPEGLSAGDEVHFLVPRGQELLE